MKIASLLNWTAPLDGVNSTEVLAITLFNGKPQAYVSEGIRDACG